MKSNSNISKYYQMYKKLFQIVFWCMWLLLPIMTLNYDRGLPWKFILTSTLLVPLFYINSSFLFPSKFNRKTSTRYIINLFGVALLFYIILVLLEYLTTPAPPKDLMNLPLFEDDPNRDVDRPRRGMYRVLLKPIFSLLFMVLISTLYALVDYFFKEEQNKEDKKKERLESELSFLRSQVSPHFLLNTLNSVLYLVRTKSEKAEELVLKLSDIIKYMIYECNNKEVPLSSEIQYLKNYIELQTVRFGEDVKITFHCDGDFSGYKIEPMLMVPYVENAFKHGTAAIVNPEIIVMIRMVGDCLELNVKNKYYTPIKQLNETGGIGKENVKRRLQLLYSDAHQLKQWVEDDWYMVQLKLTLLR